MVWPTFAVAELLRTLRSECHGRGTNQPPKRTQQHHYHFIADVHLDAVSLLFSFRPRLIERVASLPFEVDVPAGVMERRSEMQPERRQSHPCRLKKEDVTSAHVKEVYTPPLNRRSTIKRRTGESPSVAAVVGLYV